MGYDHKPLAPGEYMLVTKALARGDSGYKTWYDGFQVV